MMNDESSIIQDPFFGTEQNEYSLLPNISNDIDLLDVFDPDSFESLTRKLFEEEKLVLDSPVLSPGEYLSNTCLEISRNISQQYHVMSNDNLDPKYKLNTPLSFINAPNQFYHVRYSSEITDLSSDVNVTNKKTKKNISGRYLKGEHGRYVTISLPSSLYDYSNLYIRVTRLTVPFDNISFIHPYPLHYFKPIKSTNSNVFLHGPSIYYKINKEELCSGSKHFPNIVLTRLKQCELKEKNILYPFNKNDTSYPITGTPKEKINNFQLKKSQLEFRLAYLSEQTGTFEDTESFCRSKELIEIEGFAWKKSSR